MLVARTIYYFSGGGAQRILKAIGIVHSLIYSGGNDRIVDFNAAEGDVIKADAAYTNIEQTSRGTLLSFDDGGQIMLSGISASDVQLDWFF